MSTKAWWETPFPHKATVRSDVLDEAVEWLVDHGYQEWIHWNVLFMGHGHRFEFVDEEVHTLFVLRWVS